MLQDHFTTNFILPDGSYGTLDNGTYHSVDGFIIDFLSGSYTSGTVTGNIYASSSPPNPADLPIPTPYTASGVGSAIPVTALGNLVTYTDVVHGTTVAPTIVSGKTIALILTSYEIITSDLIRLTANIPETSVAVERPTTVPGITIYDTTFLFTSNAGSTATSTANPVAPAKTPAAASSAGNTWRLTGTIDAAAVGALVLYSAVL